MYKRGFTLAELLIALAILGVIATFTIPKVLQSQSDGKYKAMAKEASGMFAESFQTYRLTNGLSASMGSDELLPYINYVSRATTSNAMDNCPGCGGAIDCSNASNVCLRLHNGGMLRLTDEGFGGTATTNAIYVDFDPDGKVSTVPAVEFYIYYDGFTTSCANMRNNTYTQYNGPMGPSPSLDPSWFNWN